MRPVLVINPRSDTGFVKIVQDLVFEQAVAIEVLEARLRETYAHALVRRRTLSGESVETWYVYREGTWIPSDDDTPRQTSRPPATTWPPTPDASPPSKK